MDPNVDIARTSRIRTKEDAMTTLERPREELLTAPVTQRRSRAWIAVILVAVIALAVGGVGGWMVRGEPDTPAILLAGSGELTARQEQLLDTTRAAEAAWQTNDVDAILALYAPNGTFEAFGAVYRVDDGSLRTYIESGEWSSLDVLEPMLVRDNEVLTFHDFGGALFSESLTYTGSGDVLIVSHVIHT
jgi:hypothetical protein